MDGLSNVIWLHPKRSEIRRFCLQSLTIHCPKYEVSKFLCPKSGHARSFWPVFFFSSSMDPSSSFPFESWKPGGLIVGGFVNLSTNFWNMKRLKKHNTEPSNNTSAGSSPCLELHHNHHSDEQQIPDRSELPPTTRTTLPVDTQYAQYQSLFNFPERLAGRSRGPRRHM